MRQEIPVHCFSISLYVLRHTDNGEQVLILKRQDSLLAEQWCQICGRIEAGETAWQTALREAKEETGLIFDQIFSANYCEQFYEVRRNAIILVPVFIAYAPRDCRIQLNHEHSAYLWTSFKQAKEYLPFPGQHLALEYIERFFIRQNPHSLLAITP